MLFRELDAGLCFETISESNIVITQDGLVKIKKDNSKDKSDHIEEENVHAMGNIIDNLVASSSPRYSASRNINPELRHLLGLLRRYKVGCSPFLIKYHTCNVPLTNRPAYYLLIHDHLLEIIRWNYPGLFICIMAGLEIPSDWYPRMETNFHILRFLKIGFYDPKGTKQLTVPDIEPLKCFRNLSSHSREGAASAHQQNIAKYGLNSSAPSTFSKEDLSRAIYTRAPMAMCSLAKGLDAAGELSKLAGIQDLFPWRLQVLKDEQLSPA